MKQKRKALLILWTMVLLLAVGTATLAFYQPNAEAEDEQTAVWQITDISVSEVGALAITNSHGTFGVLSYNGALELVTQNEADGEHASVSELRSLVYTVSHLSSSKKLSAPASLAQYGYDSPTATVVLMLNDGSQLTLRLLMQSSMDGGYYLYREDTKELFLLDAATASFLLRSPLDFTEHSVFPAVSATELGTVTELTYESADGGYCVSGQEGGFTLTSPIRQKLRSSVLYQTLIYPLGALYGEECLASRDALDAYGLDTPDFSFSMTVDGEHYTALFRADGDTYLMGSAETGAVYRISADDALLLPTDIADLLDGMAYYYSLGDCRSLCLRADGRELLYELSGSGESISASINGTTLDAETVLELSNTVNSAAILRRLDGEPTGESVLTVQFTLNAGSIETVAFLPLSDGSYAVSVNGSSIFSTSAATVEAILALFE